MTTPRWIDRKPCHLQAAQKICRRHTCRQASWSWAQSQVPAVASTLSEFSVVLGLLWTKDQYVTQQAYTGTRRVPVQPIDWHQARPLKPSRGQLAPVRIGGVVPCVSADICNRDRTIETLIGSRKLCGDHSATPVAQYTTPLIAALSPAVNC
jgi:hypothetical protein